MSLLPKTKKEFFVLLFLIISTTTILTVSSNTALDTTVLNIIDSPNYLYPLAPGLPILVSMLDWQHCAQTGNCLDNDFILFATLLLNSILMLVVLFGVAYAILKKNFLASLVRVLGCLFLVTAGTTFSFASGYQSFYFVRIIGLILLAAIIYYKVKNSQRVNP